MVLAVDTFDGRGTPNPENTLSEFETNMRTYGLELIVKIFKGESKNAFREGLGEFFNFVFIDGAHDKSSIEEDYALALRTIRHSEETLIAFHDYEPNYPDVVEFIDNLLATRYDKHKHVDGLIVLKPKSI